MCGIGTCSNCQFNAAMQNQSMYQQSLQNAQASQNITSGSALGNYLGGYSSGQTLGGYVWYSNGYTYPNILFLSEDGCRERISAFLEGKRSKEEVITYLKMCLYEKEIDTLQYLEYVNEVEEKDGASCAAPAL